MKTLITAIEAFNKSSRPQIVVFVTRDTRTVARLPRVGHEIIVKDADPDYSDAKVTAEDIAWLCEEARRASAPGMALLEATLSALSDLDDRA
jgi:hypothetical protein